jgi:hypothetical protein
MDLVRADLATIVVQVRDEVAQKHGPHFNGNQCDDASSFSENRLFAQFFEATAIA